MVSLCDHQNIKTLGSLKFDVASDSRESGITHLLPDGFLICAASTHKGEDAPILSAFKRLNDRYPEIRFVVAPRHLERLEQIVGILERLGLEYTLRSGNRKCATPVLVLDSMGELAGVFAKCELVVMGGSFIKRTRWHNIMEPSRHKNCILCGRHTALSNSVFAMYHKEDALVLTGFESLFDDLEGLVSNRARARQVGENAFRVIQKNRGAAQRIHAEVLHGLSRRGNT